MKEFNSEELLNTNINDDNRKFVNIFLSHQVEYLGNKNNKKVAIIAIADFDADIEIDGVGCALFDNDKQRIAVILKHDKKESILLFPEMNTEGNPTFKNFFQNIKNVYEHGAMAFCAKTKSGDIITLPIE